MARAREGQDVEMGGEAETSEELKTAVVVVTRLTRSISSGLRTPPKALPLPRRTRKRKAPAAAPAPVMRTPEHLADDAIPNCQPKNLFSGEDVNIFDSDEMKGFGEAILGLMTVKRLLSFDENRGEIWDKAVDTLMKLRNERIGELPPSFREGVRASPVVMAKEKRGQVQDNDLSDESDYSHSTLTSGESGGEDMSDDTPEANSSQSELEIMRGERDLFREKLEKSMKEKESLEMLGKSYSRMHGMVYEHNLMLEKMVSQHKVEQTDTKYQLTKTELLLEKSQKELKQAKEIVCCLHYKSEALEGEIRSLKEKNQEYKERLEGMQKKSDEISEMNNETSMKTETLLEKSQKELRQAKEIVYSLHHKSEALEGEIQSLKLKNQEYKETLEEMQKKSDEISEMNNETPMKTFNEVAVQSEVVELPNFVANEVDENQPSDMNWKRVSKPTTYRKTASGDVFEVGRETRLYIEEQDRKIRQQAKELEEFGKLKERYDGLAKTTRDLMKSLQGVDFAKEAQKLMDK